MQNGTTTKNILLKAIMQKSSMKQKRFLLKRTAKVMEIAVISSEFKMVFINLCKQEVDSMLDPSKLTLQQRK